MDANIDMFVRTYTSNNPSRQAAVIGPYRRAFPFLKDNGNKKCQVWGWLHKIT